MFGGTYTYTFIYEITTTLDKVKHNTFAPTISPLQKFTGCHSHLRARIAVFFSSRCRIKKLVVRATKVKPTYIAYIIINRNTQNTKLQENRKNTQSIKRVSRRHMYTMHTCEKSILNTITYDEENGRCKKKTILYQIQNIFHILQVEKFNHGLYLYICFFSICYATTTTLQHMWCSALCTQHKTHVPISRFLYVCHCHHSTIPTQHIKYT